MLARIAQAASTVADWIVGWLLLASVLINVAQVFTRYVMNDPFFWTEEAIRYITVWFTFLGAAAVGHADEHMDMNMFSEIKSPAFQALHKILLQGLTIALAAVVLWQGARYTILNGRQTAPTTGLLMMYAYSAMPIGATLIIIVALNKIAEACRVLVGAQDRT